jgi:hypothetical protein
MAGTVAPDHRPLTSLFGGGSPAPAPKQEPPAAMQARRKPQTLEEYRQMEEEQRHAVRLQEIARSLGASDAKSEEDLQREQMEQQKKRRDRGGGISR